MVVELNFLCLDCLMPETGYKVGIGDNAGKDLSEIFKSGSGGSVVTHYKTSDLLDLNTKFKPIGSGIALRPPEKQTGYTIANGTDLCDLFAMEDDPKEIFYIKRNVTESNDYFTAINGQLTFTTNANVEFVLVGGGGAGGEGNITNNQTSYGGGGGGGGLVSLKQYSVSESDNILYSIGIGGNQTIGGNTTLSINTNNIIASGGNVGNNAIGGVGGAVGTEVSGSYDAFFANCTKYEGGRGGSANQSNFFGSESTAHSNQYIRDNCVIPDIYGFTQISSELYNNTIYKFSGGGTGGLYSAAFYSAFEPTTPEKFYGGFSAKYGISGSYNLREPSLNALYSTEYNFAIPMSNFTCFYKHDATNLYEIKRGYDKIIVNNSTERSIASSDYPICDYLAGDAPPDSYGSGGGGGSNKIVYRDDGSTIDYTQGGNGADGVIAVII